MFLVLFFFFEWGKFSPVYRYYLSNASISVLNERVKVVFYEKKNRKIMRSRKIQEKNQSNDKKLSILTTFEVLQPANYREHKICKHQTNNN